MCHVSPYNVPTAQGSPLPSPQPSWAECVASVREGMAFREQDEGLAVPVPAHSKAQTPPTPRPAVVATPQHPPHALLCCWCFSLLGHKNRTGGHGQARQPPALTVAPSAPCPRVGFALPLAPTLQHPLDPGFLSAVLEMGQSSGLPLILAAVLSTFSNTRSSFTPGAALGGQTPGEGLQSPGSCTPGGGVTGTRGHARHANGSSTVTHSHRGPWHSPNHCSAPHGAEPLYCHGAECTHGCLHLCLAAGTS